jgi:hypothetical protein
MSCQFTHLDIILKEVGLILKYLGVVILTCTKSSRNHCLNFGTFNPFVHFPNLQCVYSKVLQGCIILCQGRFLLLKT